MLNNESGPVSTGLPIQDQGGSSFLPSDSNSLDEIGKITQATGSKSSDLMLSELELDQPELIAASAPSKDRKSDELTGLDSSTYLSDLDWIDATNGWGEVEKDTSNGDKKAGDGQEITLDGKSYEKGLGVHAGSEIAYKLDGNYITFRSDIGIDDEVGDKGSATFQVWADGDKLFDSGVMKGDSSTKQVDVDVSGKQELKLVVSDGGDKNFDHASWADARLIGGESGGEDDPKPTPEPDPKPDPEPKPPSSGGSGEQARSADSFVDSIGVAGHLHYRDTAYGKYQEIVKPRLEELGVRHFRTGGRGDDFLEKVNDLAKSGIKSTLVADPRDGNLPSNFVDNVLKKVPNAVEAVEGPNELDVHPEVKYKGKSFPEGLRNYQNDLFKEINSDPATKDIDVLSPSIAHRINSPKLGHLDSVDKVNMHHYAGGLLPTNKLESEWIPLARKISDKPIVVTESGYHNALNAKGQPMVSKEAEAKYTPRSALDYFNEPEIERGFRYELINVGNDNSQRTNWGLLNADGSPQPAFNALRNLIDLTEDPDGAKDFTPSKLDYKLSGDLKDVNHTLLQKSDGKFDLVLWQDALSYDTDKKKDISVPDNKVTLSLGDDFNTAKTYLPVDSAEAVKTYSNPKSIDLSIPDHPLVVELS